jgi:hypothetical protein
MARRHQLLDVDLVSREATGQESVRRRRHRGDIDTQPQLACLGPEREQREMVLVVLDRRAHVPHESLVGLPAEEGDRHGVKPANGVRHNRWLETGGYQGSRIHRAARGNDDFAPLEMTK